MSLAAIEMQIRRTASGRPNPADSPAEPGLAAVDTVARKLSRPAGRAQRARPGRAVGLYVAAVWSRLLTWQMRRATRLLLNSLDDRALAALGLGRDEIDSVLDEINWNDIRRG